MSFTGRVRSELARLIPDKTCCRRTELLTLLRLDGHAAGGARARSGLGLEIVVDNAATARKAYTLFKHVLQPGADRLLQEKTGSRSYRVAVCDLRADDTVFSEALQQGFMPGLLPPKSVCCVRSVLRVIIMRRSSFADPQRQNHLELALPKSAVHYIELTLGELALQPGLMMRKSGPVLYFKDGDAIVELLKQVGAHSALLALENIRSKKQMRNSINRLVNAETANVDKIITAAMKQLAAIRLLDEHVGLANLPHPLVEAAALRTQHPYAPLQELAELAVPPVSKSTIRYRLNRLVTMADKLAADS